ncbi:MAG: RNA polymerase sigma-70 factor [Chitinophagaceae bacterium]|nr:RNA polymerase sigma-70 factor [Chitinophagaceae bacterium]
MQPAPWSDPNELLTALRQGDEAAYYHVFQLYNKSLFLSAYKIVSDTQEAEDIVSETFIKLWNNRQSFSEGYNIKAWLFRVGVNLSLDRLKKNKRYGLAEEEAVYFSQKEEDTGYLETLILESELVDMIFSSMDEMPDAMKTIFRMHYVEGLSSSEIARQLDISVDTVRVQKHRALLLLKKIFPFKDPPE